MMFYDVLWCSMMFFVVLWCSLMFYDDLWWSKIFSLFLSFLSLFLPFFSHFLSFSHYFSSFFLFSIFFKWSLFCSSIKVQEVKPLPIIQDARMGQFITPEERFYLTSLILSCMYKSNWKKHCNFLYQGSTCCEKLWGEHRGSPQIFLLSILL